MEVQGVNNTTYYCIDNGVSGSIGVIYPDRSIEVMKMPIFKSLSYQTTKETYVNRVDTKVLLEHMAKVKAKSDRVFVLMERPLNNPGKYQATLSAMRAMEATLICIEQMEFPMGWIDSKKWQKELLPKGVSGEGLKLASKEVATRLVPECKEFVYKTKKHDGDGILIAECARRLNL